MNTEITDNTNATAFLVYDAGCRFCVALARRCAPLLRRRGFALLPLQTPGVCRQLELTGDRLLAEMRLLLPDGRILGGADAFLEIGRRFWWARPFSSIGRFPAVTPLLRSAYRWIARHRHCADGACAPAEPRLRTTANRGLAVSALPLLVLPTLALLFARGLEAWMFMWAMAFALYGGCKWLTWSVTVRRAGSVNRRRAFGYLLAWPGMDAAAFLSGKNCPARPSVREWISALANACLGAMLVWVLARLAMPLHPLLTGWIGMVGIVLILHFGALHLLSLGWRRAGINAATLMRSPLLSRSLAEFWGQRWNRGFHELADRFVFRPLRRPLGAAGATWVVFLVSGLIHELVISFPARGGYGLPTAYFLIQGLGIICQHTSLGRLLGLGRGLRGWLFTMLVVAGPVFGLFPPPFVHRVILPMLQTIGAI